ncbi:15681_t:CDS:2 [Dentiscutata erythropus]|uniref:glutathione transferase n=1 Tax=Dentiscutata erythropus TaxID=1348616 RepID=A0A9N9EGM5_9GLOM|nr:15681_t:CDS:2 [Dentiscutata erythropus]
MAIKLIGFPQSPFTLGVVLTLNELGLPFELDPVTDIKTIKTEDFLANKHPLVPVLYDGDFVIHESLAICRYLVSKYQNDANVLIPDDLNKSSIVEQYISYEISYYFPPLQKIIYQEMYNRRNGRPVDEAVVKQALEDIGKVLDIYEKVLEGKDYLSGEYSLADLLHIACAQFIYASTAHSDIFEKRLNVKRWIANLRNRDAFKKTYA